MSNTKVVDFLNKIGEDALLQTELAQALEADNDREAVTALAKSKGYEFSSDELWAEVQKRQSDFSARQAAGELSDAELEAVSGGLIPLVPVGISVATAIVGSAGTAGFSAAVSISKVDW
jgi:predicted ribosomally synthesized peptide with nif11-like leader